MLIMTSSSTILTGEEEERRPSDDNTTPHSRRRCWSSPIDYGDDSLQSFNIRSLVINSDDENPECREHRGVSGENLHEYFSCSSDNGYSFYLGGQISPGGPSKPPRPVESRSIPPPSQTTEIRGGDQRSGRSVTRKRDIPPYLTTLDCNGRPRFHHRRVRSEGRLEIASVAVDLPEIVSVRGREGLRIGTVRISQGDDQQNH